MTDRARVAPAAPQTAILERHGQTQHYAFSHETGLIAVADSREAALEAYARALPERRPLDFPWGSSTTETPSPPRAASDLSFDVFHPLMHRWASPECFGWYGGPWQHMRLWWEYSAGWWRPSNIWADLRCRFGRHEPVDVWTSEPETRRFLNLGGSCANCSIDLPRPWSDPFPPI